MTEIFENLHKDLDVLKNDCRDFAKDCSAFMT